MEIARTGAAVWPDGAPVEFGAWYGAYVLFRGRVGVPGQNDQGMVQLMNYALEQSQGVRAQVGQRSAVAVSSKGWVVQ